MKRYDEQLAPTVLKVNDGDTVSLVLRIAVPVTTERAEQIRDGVSCIFPAERYKVLILDPSMTLEAVLHETPKG